MNIPVSKTHGVNPTIGLCPNCNKENGEIVLVGRSNKAKCTKCNKTIYGLDQRCPECNGSLRIEAFDVAVPQHITGKSLCKTCQNNQIEMETEINNGGIPWKCEDCGSTGVIKASSEFAIQFKKDHPDHGVIFNQNSCPRCGPGLQP